jgi:hypothetical protein
MKETKDTCYVAKTPIEFANKLKDFGDKEKAKLFLQENTLEQNIEALEVVSNCLVKHLIAVDNVDDFSELKKETLLVIANDIPSFESVCRSVIMLDSTYKLLRASIVTKNKLTNTIAFLIVYNIIYNI